MPEKGNNPNEYTSFEVYHVNESAEKQTHFFPLMHALNDQEAIQETIRYSQDYKTYTFVYLMSN